MNKKILFPDGEILLRNFFRVAQDQEVPIPGFFIVSSLRKLKSISEFSDEEAYEFINLLMKVRKGMKKVLNIKEVYLFQNEGINHNFHFWIFPHYKWMEKFGKGIKSVKLIMNYAQENMLNKENFEKVRGSVNKMKEYFENPKSLK